MSIQIPEIKELRDSIKKGKRCPVILIAGGDDGLREGVEEVFSEDLKGSFTSVTIIRIDSEVRRGEEWVNLAQVSDNPPMFGDAYIVVAYNVDGAQIAPALSRFLDSPPPHVRLILIGDKKVTQSGLASCVSKIGKVIIGKDLREREALRTLIEYASDKGLKIDINIATMIIDMVGTDRSVISHAVETLLEYKGKGGLVTERDLHGIITRTRKTPPWDLEDAIAERDLSKAIKVIGRIINDTHVGSPVLNILFIVVGMVRKILMAKSLIKQGLTDVQAMEKMKIKYSFQWERLTKAQSKYSYEELISFLRYVPEIEIRSKRNQYMDDAIATEMIQRLISK